MISTPRPPTVLVVLDGWGLSETRTGNAIAQADTPVMDNLVIRYPSGRLWAHGEHVGLAPGQMGNSNVGHLNLGAGRVVLQDMPRIHRAIEDGSFFDNSVLQRAMSGTSGCVHLYGLVSDGGVHSHIRHLEALLELGARLGIPCLRIHAITDGRDTLPRCAHEYIHQIEGAIAGLSPQGSDWRIASVMGRYWAMDRDRRWDRVQLAYRTLVRGQGRKADSALEALETAYARGESDEFITPTAIRSGEKTTQVDPGDSLISFNFRADRARQLAGCLGVSGTPIGAGKPRWTLTTLTLYDQHLGVPVAFPPENIRDPVGEVVSSQGLRQLRVAETEKYAHVTYFYNGGRETEFPGEDRILVPSPRVKTYDQRPEMSAAEVTQQVTRALDNGLHDFILVNYANADMVGHTGVFEAAVKAVETVDGCLGTVISAVQRKGGQALVLSDHGNAEQMRDPGSRQCHTAHTNNPVPVVLVSRDYPGTCLSPGVLADAGPTILEMLGLPVPSCMTASSLLPREE